ncbi:MAG: amidohydrolase family protein [Armatimonadota bacterium]|nr:MAG: amidohydrolase family protein [Armatimonadota bacterium]
MFAGSEFKSVRKALDEIPIIDTHEHYGKTWNSPETTLYGIFRQSYVGAEWLAHDSELEDDPASLIPWLEPVRDNSYTFSLLRAVRQLYNAGEAELDHALVRELADKVHAAYQDEGWALSVLRKAGIEHTIVDPLPVPGYPHDEPSFHLALRSHMLVHGYDRAARDHGGDNPFEFAAKLGHQISSFDDYLDYVDFWVRHHKEKGAVAIKSALAYERDIDVKPVTRKEAERIFDTGTKDPEEQKKFGDFILDLLAKKAAEYDLVFQVHAGLALQATSHPCRLMWLLDNNPDTIFDLFHAGYPWTQDVLAMAAERPNLIVDTCWLPIISPTAAVRFYHEYPEVARRADTLLWGGDNWYAEESYGAAQTFKDCLAKAVSEKVEGGRWTRKEGLRFAEGVMWRAAGRWFGISL